MGIWRRDVVVGRACGRKRVKNQIMLNNNRKLRQLQKIIPGGGPAGQAVDPEALFQRIAVYIYLLESRVKVLKSAYTIFGPHD